MNFNEQPIDIAVTCYNTGKYIEECIESIIYQTYKNWNLIIVDDHSKDQTLNIIKSTIKKFKISKKCKLFTLNENCGYGMSLKTAIEKGSSDIIFIVDSDDILAENMAFEKMVNAHKKFPNASLIYSNYYECTNTTNKKSLIKCREPRYGETYLGKFSGYTYLGSHLTISHLKSFKRKYYNMTEGLNPMLKKAVDKDLILKLEEVGELKYINEDLYIHRKHNDSISSKFKSLRFIDQLRILEMKTSMYLKARDRRRNKVKNEDIIG